MLKVQWKKRTSKPGASVGTRKALMPRASPGLPEVRAKTMSSVALCSPLLKRFSPSITQFFPSRTRARLEPGGVAAVIRLGQPEGDALLPGDHALQQLGLLRRGAEAVDHVHLRKVSDDRRFVLKIVVESEPLVREVLADDRHRQVAAALPAELFGQRVAQVPGAIGAPPHFGEQLLPLLARRSVRVPVGARVLAAVIEELRVLALERSDLLLDEGIELGELGLDLGGDAEVHLGETC